MKNLRFKKTRLIPHLSDNENKRLFRGMNIALIIGGLSLVSTLLYLLANLDKADKIVLKCLPGFVLGIVLMILYAIGHQKLAQNKRQPRFDKKFSFGR